MEHNPICLAQPVPGCRRPCWRSPAAGPRKVYFRWLKDSKKYNEWMNAIDYETDEGAAEQEQRAAEAQAAEAQAASNAGSCCLRAWVLHDICGPFEALAMLGTCGK